MSSLSKLHPDDFVCFNLGNSYFKMMNDHQKNLKEWQSVKNRMAFLRHIFEVDKIMTMLEEVSDIKGD